MLESKVVLITGASSGFGRATGTLLAARGYRVFGTRRNPRGENDGGFEMLKLEVTSEESASSCVSNLFEKAGRVDVLINNAGYALAGGLEETSVQEAKALFDTNFFGAVRLTDAVLPSMRRQKSGQIINIGSIAGTIPIPFEGFYAAAKAALLAYSETLRHEVKPFNIKVSIVEPGFFRTNIGNASKNASGRIEDYMEARKRAVGALLKDIDGGRDPNEVAETIAKIIATPSPRLRYAVGKERRYLLLKKLIPASMFESSIRNRYRLDG